MDGNTHILPLRKKRSSQLEMLATKVDHADLKRERRKAKSARRIPEVAFAAAAISEETVEDIQSSSAGEEEYLCNYHNEENHKVMDDTDDDSNDSIGFSETSSTCTEVLLESLIDIEANEVSSVPSKMKTQGGNRLLHFEGLKDLIEKNCTCSSCHGRVTLSEITIGLATTAVLACNDCNVNEQRSEPSSAPIDGDYARNITGLSQDRIIAKTGNSFRDFPVHYSLVLLMQQLGCGLEGIRAVLSHLDMSSTVGDWVKWRELMDVVGVAEQQVAQQCMENNMREETRLSEIEGIPCSVDTNGIERQGIAASIDMGWQKRSSGNRYDSCSGVSLMFGALSKSIIGKHVCSTHCRVCDETNRKRKNNTTPGINSTDNVRRHRCPKNYVGSSKGMEAEAAVQCVKDFQKTTLKLSNCAPAFVYMLISDDDSSTWANLQQNMSQKLFLYNRERERHGLAPLTKYQWSEWPRNVNGKLKEDYGKLNPEELPPRVNLADPNHRTKVLGKYLYPLTKEKKTSGKRLLKTDAERFKLNFGKALYQYRNKTPEELRDGLLATLEHEFNNHEYCSGDWCKWLKTENNPMERAALEHRWWSKEDNRELYSTLHDIYMKFLTPERVQQMRHPYDTQKNESMNAKISRSCPKSKTFSKSMVLADRVAFVVAEDSIGGAATIETLYKLLGFTNVPHHLLAYYASNDKKRERHHQYTLQANVKHRRRKTKNEQIWEARRQEQQSRKKGQQYGGGMGFVGEQSEKMIEKSKKKGNAVCAACGASSHLRRSSKLCPMNKANLGTTHTTVPPKKTSLKAPPVQLHQQIEPNSKDIRIGQMESQEKSVENLQRTGDVG